MNNASRVQLGQRGVLTLPSELRKRYDWQPGIETVLRTAVPFAVGTPGDCIRWLRTKVNALSV